MCTGERRCSFLFFSRKVNALGLRPQTRDIDGKHPPVALGNDLSKQYDSSFDYSMLKSLTIVISSYSFTRLDHCVAVNRFRFFSSSFVSSTPRFCFKTSSNIHKIELHPVKKERKKRRRRRRGISMYIHPYSRLLLIEQRMYRSSIDRGIFPSLASVSLFCSGLLNDNLQFINASMCVLREERREQTKDLTIIKPFLRACMRACVRCFSFTPNC